MKYKIATFDGVREVTGETFKVGDYTCVVHTDEYNLWRVSELSTGFKVCHSLRKDKAGKDEAIKECKRLFRENDETKFIKRAKKTLDKIGIKFPVNG